MPTVSGGHIGTLLFPGRGVPPSGGKVGMAVEWLPPDPHDREMCLARPGRPLILEINGFNAGKPYVRGGIPSPEGEGNPPCKLKGWFKSPRKGSFSATQGNSLKQPEGFKRGDFREGMLSFPPKGEGQHSQNPDDRLILPPFRGQAPLEQHSRPEWCPKGVLNRGFNGGLTTSRLLQRSCP
ncbi:hypothetical protein RRG08_000225 [Elysia crispata]|uniref:Uncharacterized protein n=1 Tax=Elysia crispata TaxID=231223 RepID=A0AAE1AWT3_9GAST|nr:hypothetical protein RRG08_000225 [Elysia crispata]